MYLDAKLKPLGITFAQLKAQGIFEVQQDFTPIRSFGTPTGKIELYSTVFEKAGFDPLPSWKESPLQPTTDYPMYFVTFDEATNNLSQSAWNPYLSELMDNGLWINTDTAESLGIKNGDNVLVESPYGKITAQASVTDKVRTDTIAFAHGRGYLNPSNDTWSRKGVNENPLTRSATRQNHIDWYQNKDEPWGVCRYTDFTVKVSKAQS